MEGDLWEMIKDITGKSYSRLERELGISPNSISRLRKRGAFSHEMLWKCNQILGINKKWLEENHERIYGERYKEITNKRRMAGRLSHQKRKERAKEREDLERTAEVEGA